jgi:hypothetical protein
LVSLVENPELFSRPWAAVSSANWDCVPCAPERHHYQPPTGIAEIVGPE